MHNCTITNYEKLSFMASIVVKKHKFVDLKYGKGFAYNTICCSVCLCAQRETNFK